jgi:hypothetical protein
MTVIALRRRHKMICRLVGDMTFITGAGHDACMIEYGRRPRICRVAIVAGIAAGDVRGAFALGDTVVVTGAARTDNLQMINPYDWLPRRRAMTIFANVRGIDVARALACGGTAVVATAAVRCG